MIVAVVKGKEAKGSNSEKKLYSKKKTRCSCSSISLCGVKNTTTLLKQWIKDDVIYLREIDFLPLQEIRKIRNTVLIIGRKNTH